ncbi:hypothetical protein EJB05_37089, partial [Eragrostis curvula]
MTIRQLESSSSMKLLIAMAGLLAFAAESSAAQCRYEVVVQTGDRTNAGTDARVSLQVSSANNGSQLFVPNLESWGEMYADHDYFEKGNLDRFGGNGPCMPYQPLDMVITSDGSGNKPSWYVDYVQVTQLGVGGAPSVMHKWSVNQWLATDMAPHLLNATRNGCGVTA